MAIGHAAAAGEVLPMVEGLLQLEVGGDPGPVAGDGAGAVRAPALHLPHLEHPGAERVPHWHKEHAVVRQLGDRRQPATPLRIDDAFRSSIGRR